MKKILTKILLILLPIVGYFVLFFIFEPYNYFGLKSTANTNSVIYRTRDFLQQPSDSIIVGDSRLAHLNMDLVEELTGERYSNLSFGGASLSEAMDLYEFALEHNENLKNVVLSISFYTLNSSYQRDRTDQIELVVNNPLAYMTNFSYNLEMLNEIWLILQGQRSEVSMEQGVWDPSDFIDEQGEPLLYRQNLLDYAEQSIYPNSQDYELNTEAVDRIVEISRECDELGINFTVVFPPAHASITELVIEPLEIDSVMDSVLSRFEEEGIAVVDYENNKKIEYPQEMFYDGFHLDPVTGLDEFTIELFSHDIVSLN